MSKYQQLWVVWLGCIGLGVAGLSGCGEKRVIATVNDKPILREEFVKQLEARYGMQTLQWLITKSLVDSECKKFGITVSDAEVQERLTEWRQTQGLREEQALIAFLSSKGLTEKEVREDLKRNMEEEKLATKDVKVTEDDVKKYFAEHGKDMGRPETVTLAQVVCQDKATADKVRKQLVEGASMNAMASQYSIDPASKSNGGIVGEVPVARLGQMASTIKKIPLGGYSDPIRSPNGYVVVKVISHNAAKPAVFDQVKKQIEMGLKLQKGKQREEIEKDLLKKAKLEIDVPRYLKLKDFLIPNAGKGASPTQPGPPVGKTQAGKAKS